MPQKQPKRARLWRADGSCLRLRPASHNHVWSYDFVADRTHAQTVAETSQRSTPLYRARLALGERRCRVLSWQNAGPFLNGELFYTLKDAQILTERWRIHYNTVRPHRSLGGQPPAPETIQLASFEGSHGRWYKYSRLVTG